MAAFDASDPPFHHRQQLHRLLLVAASETREVLITAASSWATDATGSQIASVPANFFFAGLAIIVID